MCLLRAFSLRLRSRRAIIFGARLPRGNLQSGQLRAAYAPGVVATAPNITSITATTLGSGARLRLYSADLPELHNHARDPAGHTGRTRNGRRAGPPVTFRGTYSSTTAYNYGDAVAYTVGSSTTEYVSLVPGTGTNTNNAPPSSPSQWGVAATGNAYPGVSSDGSNGLIINGANTFADSTSVATAPKMGTLSVFGDSNSAGFQRPMTCGPFGTGNCGYAWLIGYHLGPNANFNDYAISGAQAEDLSSLQCMPQAQSYFGSAAQSLIMVGTNNAQYAGSTTAAQNNYNHSLLACAAFRAIPREYTIYPGSNTTQVSTSGGTFTADSTYQASMGLTTLTGGTITLNTFQASNYLVLAWYAKDGDTASASLSCDAGAVTDTLNASGYQTIDTHNGVTSTVFGTLYTFPTNATHSCTITVTASTGTRGRWSMPARLRRPRLQPTACRCRLRLSCTLPALRMSRAMRTRPPRLYTMAWLIAWLPRSTRPASRCLSSIRARLSIQQAIIRLLRR